MSISKWEHPRHMHKHKQKNETALICLTLFSLAHKHKHKHKHKKNKHVRFSCAYALLMRLCLCLCASENSIRQIGGFLLIFLFILLTLMSRVFSLVTLMLCLCASENHSPLYDCNDLDTSFLRPLRKIIWLQSCEQQVMKQFHVKLGTIIFSCKWTLQFGMWRSRVISLVDLSLSGVHTFVNFLTVVGFTVFPSPFAKRETWNKNQIDYKWTGLIGAGIKIRVYILN